MDFSYVKIKELESFASSHFNLDGYTVVITPWRARSQVQNPNAKPDDIVLILAKDDKGQVSGYLGAMPDLLQGSKELRFAWVSCWWVKPNSDKELSSKLFGEFLRIWDYRVMFSDMSPKPTGKLKLIFPGIIKQRSGYHIWLRSNVCFKIRSNRKANSRFFLILRNISYTGIFFLSDIIINSILYPLQLAWTALRNKGHLSSEILLYPTSEDYSFISKYAANDIMVPDNERTTWIIDNPWLIKKDKYNTDLAGKYSFGSFSYQNKLFWWKTSVNGKTVGLIMISLRDATLKTQFVYLLPEFKEKIIGKFLSFVLRNFSFKDFITFNEEIVNFINKKQIPVLRKKSHKRFYGITYELVKTKGDDFTMQDGSGDYIFT